jgi:L-iditol 2-dehydrogenase
MRAAVLVGPRKVLIQQLPRPTAGFSGEVVAEVRYVGVCRTDLQLAAHGLEEARVLGHEVVCRAPGEAGFFALNNEVSCGHCTYCREGLTSHCSNLRELGINEHGGYAEWLRAPRRQLHPFAFENPILGVLIEPLSCALRAEHRLRQFLALVSTGRPSVLIVGGGVSGALLSYLLSRWVERPWLQLFEISEALLPWTVGLDLQRVDVPPEGSAHWAIECTGTPGGRLVAFQAARMAGLVCLYGVPCDEASIPVTARELFHRELTVLTSFAGTTDGTMRSAIEIIQKDEPFFERLIGRLVPLERLETELVDWNPVPGTRTVVDLSD